jgi:hypothetical protein
VLRRGIDREETKDCFDRFLGPGIDGEIREALVGKGGFDGFEVRHALGDDFGLSFSVAELIVGFCHMFQLPLQENEFSIRH